MKRKKSDDLFKRAVNLIPGGVNSPVRAFGAVGGRPLYIKSGQGAFIVDADGNKYLDFCASWGPLILGHSHPEVIEAVQKAALDGLSFGTCCQREVEMAELLNECVPSMEMMRLVNSGTEATMTALRLARGFTGKSKILKFEGCYHGHSDYLLVSAGSGLLTSGISSSAGIPDNVVADILVAPYNDTDSLSAIFEKYGSEIAAVIVEPVAGNMGLVPPTQGFLETLRKITEQHGSILIFDEVITGFRLAPTTYGNLLGITPDLTTLGKIIGGGMPIGALGGKAEIMKHLAPLGSVYQAGTLSGNPVALAAGISTLKILLRDKPYPLIAKLAKQLAVSVNKICAKNKIDMQCAVQAGLFTMFFTKNTPLENIEQVKQCDTAKFAKYHAAMLDKGIYLSPSQFELGFISAVHTEEDIDFFITQFQEVSKTIL